MSAMTSRRGPAPPFHIAVAWYITHSLPAPWRAWAADEVGSQRWRTRSIIANTLLFGAIDAALMVLWGPSAWIQVSSFAALAIAFLIIYGADVGGLSRGIRASLGETPIEGTAKPR